MHILTSFLALFAVLPFGPPVGPAPDISRPARSYYAYVCSESEDEVTLVRFGPGGLVAERTIPVGVFPAEVEGPHGINVSPNGRYWYVSIAHGKPFGSVHRYETSTNEWDGEVQVGMFPASLDVSASTGLLYVVNSNFYGDPEPSTISVVETSTMTEVAQIPTGVMPHGARLSRDGTFLYSVNMMDDELVEIDAALFAVSRRLPLTLSAEGGSDVATTEEHETTVDHPRRDSRHGQPATVHTEPSWVSRPTSDGRLYVAALSGDAIFEIDLAAWTVRRAFTDTAPGPYNVDVSRDGKLLAVTYKKGDAVGFWDLDSGTELARVETTRRIPHGVAITADGRYTLATVEGIGGEPGMVEVFDNRSFQRIGALAVGKQAGGIALWRP